MKKVRTVTVAGFVADADPNVGQPSTGLFDMTGDIGDQTAAERDVEGHRVTFRAVTGATPPVDVPGATVDFTTWAYDEGASAVYARAVWNRLASEAAAPHARLFGMPLKGKLYFQITAIGSPGAATVVEVWAEESSSVAG
jgi:hypothetical protein